MHDRAGPELLASQVTTITFAPVESTVRMGVWLGDREGFRCNGPRPQRRLLHLRPAGAVHAAQHGSDIQPVQVPQPVELDLRRFKGITRLDKLLIRPTRVARPVLAAPGTSQAQDTPQRSACKRVTQRLQAPTLANPSPNSRNRHAETHSLQRLRATRPDLARRR
jgi:hypothetical protein